ncbi:error-prone DNA polymerase [Thalassoroseus pseudoceratinae]|uniref:error-prone DNA polymerase n=1 Tax=Thalassoroseus pseudoceratinae TaxID=2713176 RepID=UPI00141FAB67|nr:error-prone DNA polymerase [Thalassoroseus pseudoceratinae]
MPDPPPNQRRIPELPAILPFPQPRGDCVVKTDDSRPLPQRREASPPPTSSNRYAELHCRTNFSFQEGASHADELVNQAVRQGLAALAITDRNSLAGVVRAHTAAKAVELKLLIGAEVTPADGPPVVLWVTDRAAYGHLSRLLTVGRRRSKKGECHLTCNDIAEHADGLIAGVVLRSLLSSDDETRMEALATYRDIFGDRCYGLVSRHLGPNDEVLMRRQLRWANAARVPAVASNNVRFHEPNRRYLHDVLTAVKHHCTVADLGRRGLSNAECYLKSPDDMHTLFAEHPELVRRTMEIANRCHFRLDELRYEYPTELSPSDQTPLEYLTKLTWQGANERYPQGVPGKVRQLLEHELALIEELHYEAYFLTVWDLVRFARSKEILCQGRGSAANSAVCYCLGVTAVDPYRMDTLFERFISKERDEAPDIDVDFEHERREEVIQYVYNKYGRHRAGLAATVVTYRPRSAIRDIGKALGLSLDRVGLLAKTIGVYKMEGDPNERLREAGLDPDSKLAKRLLFLLTELQGFPRHLSQHTGGMVITEHRLDELVPIENAAMPDRTVIQWDKDDLEALGLLKVDVLALGMLTAIRRCFDFLKQDYNLPMTLADVPAEDPAVYDMACQADTIGVFQIESRAQMAMLPRLKPRCFYDLVIEVSLVRPGPIQGDMVHPYLRRRAGLEEVEFPNDRVRDVLKKTLGVPIFQEQAMKLAVVAAGFTPGEADELRRAMAAWRRKGVIEKFQQKLKDGLLANGYSPDFADRLYNQIQGFGEYGFPESHAASFALLVYVSAWLKCHYPAVFTAALLNSQPMGFYAPSQLVSDVRKHGVDVRPADVNHSDWDCTLEPMGQKQEFALRLGFRTIKGFSQLDAERLVTARGGTPFRSFHDLSHRSGLTSTVLKRLAGADAFSSLQLNRREALWQALPDQTPQPLLDRSEPDATVPELPKLSKWEEVLADYRTGGLSLKGHPVQFFRDQLTDRGAVTAASLTQRPDGSRCKIAGLVLLRQRPGSARGVTFITLEDETGTANLIIWPDTWERHHTAARRAQAMFITGRVQRQGIVTHVVTETIEDLSQTLAGVPIPARNFH